MSKPDAISIIIKHIHACGQVCEEVVHLDMEQDFSFGLSSDPLPPFGPDEQGFLWAPNHSSSIKFSLSGQVERTEVTGMEWRDRHGLCPKCGADFFPGDAS